MAAAIISLIPFAVDFFKYYEVNSNSALYGTIIIIVVITAIASLFVIKGKVEQKNITLRNEYAEHNFIFSYYKNLICNYKTGKEIRIFDQSPFIMNQIKSELIEKGIPIKQKIASRYGLAECFSDLIFAMLTFTFMLIVGIKTTSGVCSLGNALVYIGCFSQFSSGFDDMAGIFGKWKALAPRLALYESILNMSNFNSIKVKNCPQNFNSIKFQNVSFSYNSKNKNALQNVSMTINKGEKISIVGENGSGKTTFVKLLCGLHKPKAGKILIDNVDISNFSTEDYQNLFSIVFQDSDLFSLPLGENIAANEKVDEKLINECLGRVGFNDKYNLDTMIYQDCDPDGVNPSGGEIQKLVLARALYRNKPIIVLDEPTAALDPYAEFKLYEQFDKLTINKTAIYISHRLSSCQFCDRIAVFDNGQLIQFGTHKELIQDKSGKYCELWTAQAKYYNEQD